MYITIHIFATMLSLTQMITSNPHINILFWICYIIAIIVGTEIFAYIWHRYGAHSDYIPGIYDSHCIHHMSDLNLEHEADDDFVWILLIMITCEIIIGIAVIIEFISGILAIITIIVSLVVLWWNWWIHKAYHRSDHWLNSYEWFRKEKERHYIHHYYSNNNYGIASHFTDKIMGTWFDPNIS